MKKLLLLLPLLLTLFACSDPTSPQALSYAPGAFNALEIEQGEAISIERVDYIVADIHYLTSGVQTYREVISVFYITYRVTGTDTTLYAAVEIFAGEENAIEVYTYDSESALENDFEWYIEHMSDKDNFSGEYPVDYTSYNGRLSRNEITTALNTETE